ncbi:tRNA N6-adenosine(37)-threonylcarbamoyltransferase complex transferase subunit TsaD [Paramagnetospirillum marisnigri]|uniref:tRNA N6-adenosine threonylcarbamoyltransferase n=1 Tax=Paramagnetospirillum marisnigri TaxID=1285242 RepID=A0A178MK53_9PROT|nr:tRNA (adenosine(37)-N6)-threonylcarbamoyltransferase complex transferase subunit TsaD [Paramagnetospirillum marisnigri]OAN49111.1 tRNA N6-adenosine(37)-threonylcarbamoyltransferase complex transferase subunit TsaD [Paramagnetospirillum marisnigri]
MLVLGIESSCDETAAAVVDDQRRILGEVVLSQLEEHRPFGGIVPEVAARSHLQHMDRLVAEAMKRAGIGFAQLDAVAATGGPGLIGGVIVGVMTGKALALASGKPFLAINHLEGHALTARLTHGIDFPYLLLLASGGHCQLLAVDGVGRYSRLGTTIDDAAGEAFDKVAKMAGLGYPGGPAVEQAAALGDPKRFSLPRPMKGKPGCDFSFSGLKNATRLLIESLPKPLSGQDAADVCAAFQLAVAESIADRTRRAIREFRRTRPDGRHLVVAGGVAANTALRQTLITLGAETGLEFLAPPLKLCTDNAAMIAWAGVERLRLGLVDDLTFAPRPRWPLDPSAKKVGFAGVKA